MPISVFHHDNGGVHQNANGQGQPTQRHDVGADIQVVHGNEGERERDGQGENRDQRRAEMKQKHDDDQRNNNRFLDQAMYQRVYLFADQCPAVIARNDFDSRRQRSFDFSQLLLDAIDHVEGVQPIPHNDNAAHGLAFAIPLCDTFPHVWAEGNRAQILDEYGRPVLRHNRHVRQIIERLEIAEPANHVSRAAQFEYSSTDFVRARLHAVDDGRQRNAICQQLVGIDIDLVLAHEPTDARHFGHTGNGRQLVAQVPILNASKIGKALLMAVIDEHILIDPTRTGRVRADDRMHIGRKPAGNRLQILHNARTGPINIGTVFKYDEDVGVIDHGLRAYRLHLRRSQERGHDGVSNLVFDDVGRFTFPAGVNDYLHV